MRSTTPTFCTGRAGRKNWITAQGGGAVFNQAAHQVDIVRLLGGGRVRSVRAQTGAWDAARPTEGAYAALLVFDDGSYASLAYSGYAHFDGDELCGGVGEMGALKTDAITAPRAGTCAAPPIATRNLALKNARNYGGADYAEGRPRRSRDALAPAFRPRAGLLRARRSASDAERRDDLRRRREAPGPAAEAARAARRSDRRALRRRRFRADAAARRPVGDGHARSVSGDAAIGARAARCRARSSGRLPS